MPFFGAVIHAPGRLQICAVLSGLEAAEFDLLRDALKVSDSVMSAPTALGQGYSG